MTLKKWRYLWIAWILAFIGIEWAAIANDKRGDTLSEQVWQALGTWRSNPNGWQKAGRVGLAGGFLWLAYHFFPTGLI